MSNRVAAAPDLTDSVTPALERSALSQFLAFFDAVRRRPFTFALIVCVVVGATIAVVLRMPAIFRAEAQLAPASGESKAGLGSLMSQLGSLPGLVGLGGTAQTTQTEEHLAVLRSRKFVDAFIEENNLMPVLFAEQWDSTGGDWKSEPVEPPTRWQASEMFRKDLLSVSADKKSGLVTVAIEWTDPVLAARWVNELVHRLNEYQRKAAIEESERSIAYLGSELQKTSVVEMQQAIYRLIEAQTQVIMLANARDQFAFKVLDPAEVPEKKIRPRRTMIVANSLVLGVLLGLVVVQLLEAHRRLRAHA